MIVKTAKKRKIINLSVIVLHFIVPTLRYKTTVTEVYNILKFGA
jgi:hypothetical protein